MGKAEQSGMDKQEIIMSNLHFHNGHIFKTGLFITFLFLQAGAAPLQPENFRERTLSINDGLTSNTVFSIVQDQQGFIWIGTINGINKYDGQTITQFFHNSSDTNSLAINNGGNLFCDSQNKIWVGTWGAGVDLLDPLTGRFRHFRPDKNNPQAIGNDKIQTIYEDRRGTLWFCTLDGGLSRLDPEHRAAGKFINYRHDPADISTISHLRTRSMAEDKAGNLWIATDDGFCRLKPEDRDTGKFTRFKLPLKGEQSVYRVMTDHSGNLWLGSTEGLFLLKEPQTLGHDLPPGRLRLYTFDRQDEKMVSPNYSYVLQEDHQQKIWVGLSYSGLLRFDPQSGDYIRLSLAVDNSSDITNTSIRSLYQDKSQNLWIGYLTSGLSIIDLKPTKFSHISYEPGSKNTLAASEVTSLYADGKGTLWLGSLYGLTRMNRTDSGRLLFDHNWLPTLTGVRHIKMIQPGEVHELWLAFSDNGLIRLNTLNRTWYRYRSRPEIRDSLSSGKIISITKNNDASMWIATENGLNLFEPDKNRFRRFMPDPADSSSLPTGVIMLTAYDWENRLWVGTAAGLSVSTTPVNSPRSTTQLRFRNYQSRPDGRDALVNNLVNDFHASVLNGRPVMYVATAGGLSAVTEDDHGRLHFENYTIEQGLPHNLINGIQQDGRGRLWLSTFDGLSRFDPVTRVFRNYKMNDGLQGRYFTGNANFQYPDGRMIFAGASGLNFFHPDSVMDNPFPPQLVFTAFSTADQSEQRSGFIPSGTEISLAYRQNDFTVEFAALEYTNPDQNQYAYRLDGFNKDWIYPGNNRTARFMNVKPGNYTLRVKASNNDGIWTDEAIFLTIKIIPPLWLRAWFQLLAMLILGGLVWAIHQFRLRNIRRHNRMLLKEIEERKKAELLLSQSEEKYRNLIENSFDIYFTVNAKGVFTSCNEVFLREGGYTTEQVIGQEFRKLVYPEDMAVTLRAFQAGLIGKIVRFELRSVSSDGTVKWYSFINYPVVSSDGRVAELQGHARNITERKQAEAEKQETMERQQREANVVTALAASPHLANGQVEALAAELTERAAAALKTGRVGVWLFNEEETILENIDNFLADSAEHSSGAVLQEHEFRNEFEVLKTARFVDAHDPLTDPRTAGYVQDYLIPNNITSMLDAVIRLGGRNLGTLCFEHVSTPHRWTDDEISFACQCADQLALAISNRERLKADELAREMSEFNRSIISSAPVGIVTISPTGEMNSANEAFLQMMGSPGLEQTLKIGMSAPSVQGAGIAEAFKRTLSSGEPFEIPNLPYTSVWGKELVVNLKGVPQKNRDGRFIGLLLLIEDLTQSLYHKKALLQSESKFTAITQSASDAIISSDQEGRIMVWNRGAEVIFGYTENEALGQPILLIMPEKYHEAHLAGFQKQKGNNQANYPGRRMEIEGRKKDGLVFPIELSLAAWEHDGQHYYSAIIRDITQRKETEQKLIRHEDQQRVINELLRLTLENMPLPDKLNQALKIILTTHQLTVLQKGGIFLTGAGMDNLFLVASINMPDELKEKCSRISFGHCLCGQAAERREILFSLCQEGHCVKLYAQTEAHGHYNVPILSQNNVLGVLVLYLGENYAQAQGELEYMAAIANTLAAIIEQSQTQTAMQKLAAVVEQASESVVLTNTNGEIEYINPAFTRHTGYSADEALNHKTNLLKSGKQDDRFYRELWTAITDGKTWVGRFVNLRRDGSEFTEDAVIFPIKNEAGQIINFCKISRDVSHELQLEQQLHQAQKMEAIGTLAGGVAHDFNNLLTVITGYADLALAKMKEEDPFHNHMSSILLAGRKAGNLTRQLLAFSRKQIYKPEIVDLNHVISAMEKLLRRLISEDIRMDTILAERLPRIKADSAQIEQILTNLVVNARDAVQAMDKPGFKKRITIETGVSVLDESYTESHLGSKPGDVIYLSISDNGIGMDEQTKQRIFEPFFTTKAKDKGTGLGLAMVYGIVKQNQGSIYVYSEPGQGSTFKIFWPVTQETGKAVKDDKRDSDYTGDETILLVEDDAEVRKFAAASLQQLGYTVHQAGDGESALNLIMKEQLHIDLLITDLIMPEMNGRELADRIRAAFPETGILFASGYTDNHIVEGGALEAGVNFLQKPYSQQTLAEEVRRVLDKRLKGRKIKD